MKNEIKDEYEKAIEKRDEIRGIIEQMEAEDPQDKYNIRINRDRLAYWEGKTEGLKFALDRL
jgi:hypothetical protein